MNLKSKFSIAIQMLVASILIAVLLVACGGGYGNGGYGGYGGGGYGSGFERSYTASAGVGEVLQFSVDTTRLTYSYSVDYTAYASSGVSSGQSGTGALTNNGDETYLVGQSNDNFIQSGKVFPKQYGLLVGHVVISRIGGTAEIPVFGLSNPITTIARLAGTFNYQGFSCSVLDIADVSGNANCHSNYGTLTVTSTGAYNECKSGDITNQTINPCTTSASGTINALTATPGVFDIYNASNQHIGWFFAFTAHNGQTVAVIDHDDASALEYGHSVLSTYATVVPGSVDGNYFVKNNEGVESLVTILGSNMTSTAHSGVTGTLAYNSPWNGLEFFQFAASGVDPAASGIAMVADRGAYTNNSNSDPALFAVGLRY
jgi:hypothetical protein